AQGAQEAEGRSEGNLAPLDRRRSGISTALVPDTAKTSGAAGGQEFRVGTQPDRYPHPDRAGETRSAAGRRSRPANTGPAPESRFDQSAPGPRASGNVC